MKEYCIIATAGHVDHGKTTLVKALTGIDTDRLAEEKARGLTIELGFAYIDLPSHRRMAIVDVPGHEKFIKNMVAGMAGIGASMVVIDIHEGVMAQTVEHIQILKLLSITEGVIVLTKAGDLSNDSIEEKKATISRELLALHLPPWPVVVTDAQRGLGMEELIGVLDGLHPSIEGMTVEGPARLFVDRAFTVKGFGTVVTGTLIGGPVSVGEYVYAYPIGRRVRIRQIQIHSEAVETATPYHRVALNLSDVSVQDVRRGSVVSVSPMKETTIIDTRLTVVDNSPQPLCLCDTVHIHIGSAVTMAQVFPLGCDRIEAGQEGYVQLRLEKALYLCDRERFIIRAFSPIVTIGGGIVLECHGQKLRRYHEKTLARLQKRWQGEQFFHEDTEKESLRRLVLQKLWAYHKAHPLRYGMTKSQCMALVRKKLPLHESKAFLSSLVESGYCKLQGKYIRANGFVVVYSKEQQRLVDALQEMLHRERYTPIALSRVADLGPDGVELVRHLPHVPVVTIGDEYVMRKEAVQSIETLLCQYFHGGNSLTLATFRDMLHIGRKGALLILEYFDSRGVTIRKGDVRYWLKRPE